MTQTYNIYVSNSGNDTTGNGTIETPYATLAKVMSVLQDSTKIHLARGGTWRENIDLSGFNNIAIDAYGEGNKPIMSGLRQVSGWNYEGGNIWSRQDNNFPTEVTNVFIDGLRAGVCRTAQRNATAGSASTLTDTGLSNPDGHWNGAELMIFPYDWTRGLVRVTDFTSNVFTFVQAPYNYPARASRPYWIQNHINCLTLANTYAYNATTKTLYIYSTTEPQNVFVTYGSDLIYGNETMHIEVRNVNLYGSQRCGVNFDGGGHITIEDVDFNFSGIYAIRMELTRWIKLKNCIGLKQNNDFANFYNCTTIYVSDCQGIECGVDARTARYMAVPAPGGSSGFTVQYCRNLVLKNSVFGVTGYNAIGINYTHRFFCSGNNTYLFNVTKYDGGGIYMVHNQRHFWASWWIYPVTFGKCLDNFVQKGNPIYSYGIYPDNNSQDIEIKRNFVAGTKRNYHCNDCGLLDIKDNVSVVDSNSDCGLYLALPSESDRDNVIDNNLLVTLIKTTPAIWIGSQLRANVITNNKYFNPVGKFVNSQTGKLQRIGNSYYTFAEWLADQSRIDWTRTGEEELEHSLCQFDLMSVTDFLLYFTNPGNDVIEVTSEDLPYDDYVDMDGDDISLPYQLEAKGKLILTRAPKPDFSYAAVSGDTVLIYTTIDLDESSVPATGAFALSGGLNVTNVAVADNVVTLTLDDTPVGDVSITYTKPGSNLLKSKYADREMDSFAKSTALFSLTFTTRGDGSQAGYLRLVCEENVTLNLDGNGYFVDNYAGDNPTQTKVITGTPGGSFINNLYIMCTSGTSNMTFSNVRKITEWRNWTTIYANAPSIGGDLTEMIKLRRFSLSGVNTLSGSIEKMTELWEAGGIPAGVTGSIDKHSLLQTFTAGAGTTCTTVKRIKGLFNFQPGFVLNSDLVNQVLADFWFNRDEMKNESYTTRTINLALHASSQPPTGQGLIDKANLQAYRTPLNDSSRNLWTVTTK